MILHGNQRGGSKNLALHLLKEENDHVDVHELRGFISDDLVSALNEVHAVSKGTRAKQFLYSLSLNPPPQEKVSTAAFEKAIGQVEDKLGLSDQPRAIVFHEKQGRRHCHAVWSRIDTQEMKAIPLPYTKFKLMDISRELYIEHGWTMPRGMMNSEQRDPNNFTLSQWQQAKRVGKNPREIKRVFRDCWAVSDSKNGFEQALKERGYRLAKGDRRGFVALDHRCEVFAVAKWAGVKTKNVRAKLDNENHLPSIMETKVQIANDMAAQLTRIQTQQARAIEARKQRIDNQLKKMAAQQRQERQNQKNAQITRSQLESRQRQARFRKGLRGIMDRVTGKHRQTKQYNAQEAKRALQRDRQEKDALIFKQEERRQAHRSRMEHLEVFRQTRAQSLSKDIEQYRDISQQKRDLFEFRENRPQSQTIKGMSHEPKL